MLGACPVILIGLSRLDNKCLHFNLMMQVWESKYFDTFFLNVGLEFGFLGQTNYFCFALEKKKDFMYNLHLIIYGAKILKWTCRDNYEWRNPNLILKFSPKIQNWPEVHKIVFCQNKTNKPTWFVIWTLQIMFAGQVFG